MDIVDANTIDCHYMCEGLVHSIVDKCIPRILHSIVPLDGCTIPIPWTLQNGHNTVAVQQLVEVVVIATQKWLFGWGYLFWQNLLELIEVLLGDKKIGAIESTLWFARYDKKDLGITENLSCEIRLIKKFWYSFKLGKLWGCGMSVIVL